MKIVNKRLSLEEFREYVAKKDFGRIPPTFLVIHHTWKPTKDQWEGQKSIDGLKSYYESKNWSAGPHLFIAEDGIWLFTDMYEVGIHAGTGNGSLATGYSIGIEVVGDYDNEVWDGKTKTNVLGAILALTARLNIPQNKIMFHRDYSSKTCPGKAITKDWLSAQLNNSQEEPMNGEFVKQVSKLCGEDFGSNLNEKEQERAAKKLEQIRKDHAQLQADYAELVKSKPTVVEKIVEKPVEVVKIVEKIVYRDCEKKEEVKDTVQPEPKTFLDKLREWLTAIDKK